MDANRGKVKDKQIFYPAKAQRRKGQMKENENVEKVWLYEGLWGIFGFGFNVVALRGKMGRIW